MTKWYENRTLVFVWILLFFPVGLYGLWKSDQFQRQRQILITVATVVVFLLLGASSSINVTYGLVVCPIALILIWRDAALARQTKWVISGATVVFALISLSADDMQGGRGGGMAGLLHGNDCTYFRDSTGNVISRSC